MKTSPKLPHEYISIIEERGRRYLGLPSVLRRSSYESASDRGIGKQGSGHSHSRLFSYYLSDTPPKFDIRHTLQLSWAIVHDGMARSSTPGSLVSPSSLPRP